MSGRYLLDTNIIIGLFSGEAHIKSRLADVDEVFISVIVLGELYYGARKSRQGPKNVARIETLALKSSTLPCDRETARHYGVIKNQLRKQGKPIPENDIWVAANAMQHDLVLVTRDNHFAAIEGLKLAMW